MLKPAHIIRLFTIHKILVRHGLDDIIVAIPVFRSLRVLNQLAPWNWFGKHPEPRGQRIRLALEELGPIYVKLGQTLSTRRDLLPQDIADELAQLQDNVPPFAGEVAVNIIETALHARIDSIFMEFDKQPLASASVAQVHAARLHNGDAVVVKVIRPDILNVIRHDIELLKFIARIAARYSREARRLRAVEIINDYERTILDELDLVREAANASQLKRNFENTNTLYVPAIYWQWATPQVLVMERVYGVPVNDIAALKAAGVDLQKVAERGVEIFFKQVFVDNFFHADMHPGNIFIDIRQPTDPRYIAVDFGIVGALSEDDQRYLAENFLAFFKRDYRRVAELHLESGWVPSHVRVQDFEAAIRAVCEPNFQKPLKEISFAQILLRLFQTVQRFDFVIQPQLILLQKTLLHIEGLGRELYPELDLWKTAKPFMEKTMRERVAFQTLMDLWPGPKPVWLRHLPDLPDRVYRIVRDLGRGELAFTLRNPDFVKLEKQLQRQNKQRFWLTSAVSGSFMCLALLLLVPQLPMIFLSILAMGSAAAFLKAWWLTQ
ncbi:MAG: ubiquinone biosynthesis regulatory protein kinase UbiB [Gammaproteobacteria bacterium]|nr:ubiquinone biosynthesis regulatory protein kinase UbiB [Gammaproteobacteria bacterium]